MTVNPRLLLSFMSGSPRFDWVWWLLGCAVFVAVSIFYFQQIFVYAIR